MARRLKYFVGGEWRDSATQEWSPITNSSTGEVIAEAPRCTPAEVDGAVDAAAQAFGPWRDTPLPERVQVMFRFKERLETNVHDLAVLLATEMGKTYTQGPGRSPPGTLSCSRPPRSCRRRRCGWPSYSTIRGFRPVCSTW